jgi:hypothetical protein
LVGDPLTTGLPLLSCRCGTGRGQESGAFSEFLGCRVNLTGAVALRELRQR